MNCARLLTGQLRRASRQLGRNTRTNQSSLWSVSKSYKMPNSPVVFSANFRYFHNSLRNLAVVTIPLEPLGDSVSTAVVVKWLKNPGEILKTDDAVVTVETDKVTLDLKAKTAGVFHSQLISTGSEVAVGAPLYTVDSDASATAAAPAVSSKPASAAPVETAPAHVAAPVPGAGEKVVVSVPVMGESITTGSLAKWMVKVGDSVRIDEVVAVIDTDKVAVEVKSPAEGKITAIYAESGGEVEVGKPLFDLVKGSAGSKAPVPTAPAASKATAAPAAASSKAADSSASKPKADTAVSTLPITPAGERTETRVKMTRMRLRIAERLKEAQNTTAMLTTFQETDMSALIELRNKYKDDFEKIHGVKLGFMSAFVRVTKLCICYHRDAFIIFNSFSLFLMLLNVCIRHQLWHCKKSLQLMP